MMPARRAYLGGAAGQGLAEQLGQVGRQRVGGESRIVAVAVAVAVALSSEALSPGSRGVGRP